MVFRDEIVADVADEYPGRGVANPLAMVRSGAVLFDHLGETAAADTLEAAVAEQLADPGAPRPPDISGDAGIEAVVNDPPRPGIKYAYNIFFLYFLRWFAFFMHILAHTDVVCSKY
jgi:hypothetical protein